MKYQASWYLFDQILVSESLIRNQRGLLVDTTQGVIFDADFLLEADSKYLGLKPKRMYIGYKYNGGLSDHLPVFIDIYTVIKK